MGLRPADPRAFFARESHAELLLTERAHWLDTAPEIYSAALEESYEALSETAEHAKEWGTPICSANTLHELGRAWEPDFALMLKGNDGVFRLGAGAVCFPSSWALREKLGKPIDEIHSPVPGLNAALSRQIHTFLDRLAPSAAWTRENWGLSRDGNLNHH